MRFVIGAPIIAVLLSGCASTQLNQNVLDISGTITDIYTKEVLINMSRYFDDPYAIPSQLSISAGLIQTTDSITPSLTFPLSSQLVKTLSGAVAPATFQRGITTAGAGATLGGSYAQQQNYAVSPLNDADALRNQQALYRHAVTGAPLQDNYVPFRVFVNNHFYSDPDRLQYPHCVLCAVNQGVFSDSSVDVIENPKLPPRWIFADDPVASANDGSSMDAFMDLGTYGHHELFMRKADYNKGVLNDFVLFTLSYTLVTETFGGDKKKPGPKAGTATSKSGRIKPTVSPAAQTPFRVIGAPFGNTPVPERRNPEAPRVFVLPQTPSSGGPPATNQRLQPADRPPLTLTLPLQIQ